MSNFEYLKAADASDTYNNPRLWVVNDGGKVYIINISQVVLDDVKLSYRRLTSKELEAHTHPQPLQLEAHINQQPLQLEAPQELVDQVAKIAEAIDELYTRELYGTATSGRYPKGSGGRPRGIDGKQTRYVNQTRRVINANRTGHWGYGEEAARNRWYKEAEARGLSGQALRDEYAKDHPYDLFESNHMDTRTQNKINARNEPGQNGRYQDVSKDIPQVTDSPYMVGGVGATNAVLEDNIMGDMSRSRNNYRTEIKANPQLRKELFVEQKAWVKMNDGTYVDPDGKTWPSQLATARNPESMGAKAITTVKSEDGKTNTELIMREGGRASSSTEIPTPPVAPGTIVYGSKGVPVVVQGSAYKAPTATSQEMQSYLEWSKEQYANRPPAVVEKVNAAKKNQASQYVLAMTAV